MFKKGDKIVLIDDDGLNIKDLELYNSYIVDSYIDGSPIINNLKPLIILDGVSAAVAGERFISFLEFRKQKINKILCLKKEKR